MGNDITGICSTANNERCFWFWTPRRKGPSVVGRLLLPASPLASAAALCATIVVAVVVVIGVANREGRIGGGRTDFPFSVYDRMVWYSHMVP